jgi:hypothetical protein
MLAQRGALLMLIVRGTVLSLWHSDVVEVLYLTPVPLYPYGTVLYLTPPVPLYPYGTVTDRNTPFNLWISKHRQYLKSECSC